jgi:hypothetical protein
MTNLWFRKFNVGTEECNLVVAALTRKKMAEESVRSIAYGLEVSIHIPKVVLDFGESVNGISNPGW